MESVLGFMRSICFFGSNKKNKKHHNRKQRHPLRKNEQPTLQDCILSSPSFNKSSPMPATCNKRVHPNNDGSKGRLLLHKPSSLSATSNKKIHPNDDVPMERLLLDESSTLPATSTKRVHQKDNVSMEQLLLPFSATSNKKIHPNDDVSRERLLLDESSTLPATSTKRVYQNDNVSMERLLLPLPATCSKRVHPERLRLNDDEEMGSKMEGDSSSRGKRKKRVSFRMPEIAEVFIILADSPATHDSSDLQLL